MFDKLEIKYLSTSVVLFWWYYWVLFDIALNKFRGKNLFYIGTEAKADKFLAFFLFFLYGLLN